MPVRCGNEAGAFRSEKAGSVLSDRAEALDRHARAAKREIAVAPRDFGGLSQSPSGRADLIDMRRIRCNSVWLDRGGVLIQNKQTCMENSRTERWEVDLYQAPGVTSL